MHSWKHVISTNAIFHWILSCSIFFLFFFLLNLYQSFHLFTNQWFIKSTKVFKEVIFFLLHLSLPIHNATWRARVVSFYAWKPLLQYTGFRQNFWFISPESNPELWVSALISMAIYLYAIIQKDEGQCN